ncbi:MAG TPA: sugar phosphate isomerase/epimerase family protein [Acidobacteriaceae bacterium]|jgi:sugar phosphate isomerase/epimerase|nr:sugar phosphate isomerase/epimerase family protein [Acidobacteriaceae bacterium]
MQRRDFLAGAVSATMLGAAARAEELFPSATPGAAADAPAWPRLQPMAVGLLIQPANGAEESIRRVHEMGMTNCFLSLDGYLGKYSNDLAQQLRGWLEKYSVVPTAAEVVGPGPLVWDFLQGPSTIGLVPRATRTARMDALKQTSDFAALLGIRQLQTHCGFLPEDPADPLYPEVVRAIREMAQHCAGNGQLFLMETGQETPTTMSRAIQDVNQSNLGVGLDTANLILYGKANPSDAADIIGPHVRSIHAKDGRWPTDPMKLGEEVLIGTGLVDFKAVFTKLHRLGYSGTVTIEREISGPQQIADVKQEKVYLDRVLAGVLPA